VSYYKSLDYMCSGYDLWRPCALKVLHNRALQIDIYLLTY